MIVSSDLWNQFGGNPGGSGFRLVNSVPGGTSWHVDLGSDVGTSSPVLGPDGSIYIGTLDGKLVAVDPTGVVKWTVQIGSHLSRVATPAISADGGIYCLCVGLAVRDHRTPPPEPEPANFVVSVNRDGSIRWTVPIRVLGSELEFDTGSIRGAPRILSQGSKARIIFVIRYKLTVEYPEILGVGPLFVCVLAIVDELGRFLLFNRYEEKKLFVDASGGGGLDFGSATLEPPSEPAGPRLHASAEPCSDTPVVFGSFPAVRRWTIVAPGNNGMYAIQWNDQEGAIALQPALVWKAPDSRLPGAIAPSPVAFPNGLLVAIADDRATFLETDGFTEFLPHPVKIGGPAGQAMVTGGLRQMYFLVRRAGTLLVVDTNGTEVRRREMHADTVAYPVMSANFVYVPTMNGVACLTTLDLENVFLPGTPQPPPGGFSTPAIGPDGSVYFAHKFQNRTILFARLNDH
jgi:outer membrane protein assembly factor BamB